MMILYLFQLIQIMQNKINEKDNDIQEKENNDDIHEEEEEELNDDATQILNISALENENQTCKELFNKALMDTINSIGSKEFNFVSISEACKIENIVKFFKILIKEEDEEKSLEKSIKNEEGTYSQKMRTIINFLRSKKAIFNILQFDLKQIEHSAIFLYTKILDLFFLERPKSEMLDFCQS